MGIFGILGGYFDDMIKLINIFHQWKFNFIISLGLGNHSPKWKYWPWLVNYTDPNNDLFLLKYWAYNEPYGKQNNELVKGLKYFDKINWSKHQ